jgi:membrane protein YdbS with pleckstrin-like domain
VAAGLVMVGLRRQHVVALVMVAASLATVGCTMYDGGRLSTHLTAIFVAVVILAAVLALLVMPPWRHRAPVAHPTSRHLPAG